MEERIFEICTRVDQIVSSHRVPSLTPRRFHRLNGSSSRTLDHIGYEFLILMNTSSVIFCVEISTDDVGCELHFFVEEEIAENVERGN
jgi:hypothetical protein